MDGPLLPERLREVGLQTVLDEIRTLQVYRGQKDRIPLSVGGASRRTSLSWSF